MKRSGFLGEPICPGNFEFVAEMFNFEFIMIFALYADLLRVCIYLFRRLSSFSFYFILFLYVRVGQLFFFRQVKKRGNIQMEVDGVGRSWMV